MPDSLINKIINDLKAIPAPFYITPLKVNEPFLDKRLPDICESIEKNIQNAKLRLFTNGSVLTKETLSKLASLKNVSYIWVSLNEHEADMYEKVMNISFKNTIANLDILHQALCDGYPHSVIVSRVADGTSRDIEFTKFINIRFPRFKTFIIKRSDWLGGVDKSINSDVPITGCARWYEFSIMSNGKVALCCMDGKGEYAIGDVNTHGVLDIYNSAPYRKMREFTFSRLAAANPCNACTH